MAGFVASLGIDVLGDVLLEVILVAYPLPCLLLREPET